MNARVLTAVLMASAMIATGGAHAMKEAESGGGDDGGFVAAPHDEISDAQMLNLFLSAVAAYVGNHLHVSSWANTVAINASNMLNPGYHFTRAERALLRAMLLSDTTTVTVDDQVARRIDRLATLLDGATEASHPFFFVPRSGRAHTVETPSAARINVSFNVPAEQMRTLLQNFPQRRAAAPSTAAILASSANTGAMATTSNGMPLYSLMSSSPAAPSAATAYAAAAASGVSGGEGVGIGAYEYKEPLASAASSGVSGSDYPDGYDDRIDDEYDRVARPPRSFLSKTLGQIRRAWSAHYTKLRNGAIAIAILAGVVNKSSKNAEEKRADEAEEQN